ncbi:MAG: TlyA family rRNA (cytidine-2'-O)-methyltransferase [Anaerolineales bacterium]|nr:TlyA family rRNA (cytidine-2'-O)-methyltransferase [Anaerolineales bacterium]
MKKRIDILLVELGFAESRSQAQRLVMAGQVRVEDQVVPKPSMMVATEARVEVEAGPAYVSRGGEKLAAALTAYPIHIENRICADVGASTGGFTDCLLQHGAARVYAIDVGHGILHWSLRKDPRVVSMERTNARKLKNLPELVSLVTIDASFISLRLLLPVVQGWLADEADVVALIKPQFEAGKEFVGKRGVVRDPAVHRRVLEHVFDNAVSLDLPPQGILRSPILGPKGNAEFLMWCRRMGKKADATILDALFRDN